MSPTRSRLSLALPTRRAPVLRPLFGALALLAFYTPGNALSQHGERPIPHQPLVLDAVGSFFVGGRTAIVTKGEAGIYGGGPLMVDQMYVQFMVPQRPTKPAFVMVHGSTLTGKTYETTPDGRMGWYEYFTRRGFPTYVVDQVGRGRSGFDQVAFNDVRAGAAAPSSQPNLRRATMDVAWTRFRFGPKSNVPFDDIRFPIEAMRQLSMQAFPI